MIGQTISHYKITSKLGEGGMGEVYRAEDTNLKREVAIEVLPEQFTQDAERLARFQREAQVLASLNHPNIAAIHSFEHVEGETLAERVAKGPLPVEEALEVSHQIAEGLEAAHPPGSEASQCEDHARRVAALAAQAVGQPGSHAGTPDELMPRVHEQLSRSMIELFGRHRLDDRDIVHHLRKVRQQLGDGGPRVAATPVGIKEVPL